MARTRILVVISDFVGGGAEREAANLLNHLPREHFETHLCVWRDVFDYPRPRDVPVYVLEKHRPWDAPRTAWRFARLVDRLRPDIVFTNLHYVSLVSGTGLSLARHRCRWAVRLAGNPEMDFRFPLSSVARTVFRRADMVIGCSDGVVLGIRNHLRVPARRSLALPNVVDVAEIDRLAAQETDITPRPGRFTFLHAGRLVPQKNQALLFEAFARFRGQPVDLWMLGRGPLEPSLRAQADRLGISDQVHWLGFRANPYPIFRRADAFVLSSDFEGLPNVVIEAMLLGSAVISTRCPHGPEELIEDGRTGLLTPVGKIKELSEAMGQIAQNPALRHALGGAARAAARARFETASVCAQYGKLFEGLVSPREVTSNAWPTLVPVEDIAPSQGSSGPLRLAGKPT